eukprot:5109938-Amphidinium_carterae.2
MSLAVCCWECESLRGALLVVVRLGCCVRGSDRFSVSGEDSGGGSQCRSRGCAAGWSRRKVNIVRVVHDALQESYVHEDDVVLQLFIISKTTNKIIRKHAQKL